MLGYGERVGGYDENTQCAQQAQCSPGRPEAPGAQEYAFDASVRIFDTQQNAIENEIIRAREDGHMRGYKEGYEQANKSWNRHSVSRELHEDTVKTLQQRNQNQYDMLTAMEQTNYKLAEENRILQRHLDVYRIAFGAL